MKKEKKEDIFFNASNPNYINFKYEDIELATVGKLREHDIDRLKVTLKIMIDDYVYREKLNLFVKKDVENFAKKAGAETKYDINEIIKAINLFTDKLEYYYLDRQDDNVQLLQLNEDRQNELIEFLKAPNLINKTIEKMKASGIIGNDNQMITLFLAFTSRLNKPVSVICFDNSDYDLASKVAELIHEDDKLEISRLTENSLYYMDKYELNEKLILINDLKAVEKVGVPLVDMISKQKISKITPIKDRFGNLKTSVLQVNTKASICIKTKKEKIKHELSKLTMLLHIDNNKEIKEKLINYQRKKASGKINALIELTNKAFLIDIQKMLNSIRIINPFAEDLIIPSEVLQPVLTNELYLNFIEAIAFFHQYQRNTKINEATKETYIEVTIEDIELANKLIKENIINKSHVLSKNVRLFYENLYSHIQKQDNKEFLITEISKEFNKPLTTVKRYFNDLKNYGFIFISGGNRYREGYKYKLADDKVINEQNSIEKQFNEVIKRLKKTTVTPKKKRSN